MMNIHTVLDYLQSLQQRLTQEMVTLTGDAFTDEKWRSQLGWGRMMSVDRGAVFERAGVNFSQVSGDSLPAAASARHPQWVGRPYQAAGVSLVVHPLNPYCPTAHLNVRVFAVDEAWWFGGGMDLTPYYGFVEDCQHFHQTCRRALDALDTDLYPRFKKQCDDYFVIRHRQEARGVGGVFFDDFNEHSFDHAFAVMQAVGDSFLPAYLPIMDRRRETPYGELQRQWQQHRRGRYVEFNLVWDRGTLFGLQAGGQVEAILMSLPPSVQWGRPALLPGPAEKALLTDFLPPRQWA